MIGKARDRRVFNEINVINLVDVMLCILVAFILAAPIMEQGIDVRLPTSTPSKIKAQEDSLTVSISPPGKIYLNDQRVTLDELKKRLQSVAVTSPQTAVVLRADEGLNYGVVIKVLDGIRNSGLNRIGVATRPKAG
ncbi:MAG: biopolymer transporter ExbD [Candidatus Aureabacteria bacterium]|nr:biopolymer transporter ExbD [Candidatus Auribacterota bacterium]